MSSPVEVRELDPGSDVYREFITDNGPRFAFHSPRFLRFLSGLLPAGRAGVLSAVRRNEVLGVQPFYEDRSALGTVIASLPFHASNGGPVTAVHGWQDALPALAGGMLDLARNAGALAVTWVSDPRDSTATAFASELGDPHATPRTGQWTVLRGAGAEGLWDRLHKKTRNAIRKAQRSGVVCRVGSSEADLKVFQMLHRENCDRLGAMPKSVEVMDLLRSSFGSGFRLTLAELDGSVVAGLLLIEDLGVTEYLVPAVSEERKDTQALSLLVWEEMCSALERGVQVWNWGGTRLEQDGVHRFKSRWGTSEGRYAIRTRILDAGVLRHTPEELTTAFPHTFVVPHERLVGGSSDEQLEPGLQAQ